MRAVFPTHDQFRICPIRVSFAIAFILHTYRYQQSHSLDSRKVYSHFFRGVTYFHRTAFEEDFLITEDKKLNVHIFIRLVVGSHGGRKLFGFPV